MLKILTASLIGKVKIYKSNLKDLIMSKMYEYLAQYIVYKY